MYDYCSVTVVDSRPTMIATLSEAYHPIVQKVLAEMNLHCVNNDSVVKVENRTVELKSGKMIPCDLYIPAHPEGGHGRSFMPAGTLDKRGYVKVNDYLQLDNPNYLNVFALGDW